MERNVFFSFFSIKEQLVKLIDSYSVDPELLITPEQKRLAALNLTQSVSRLCATISLQPLPVADILFLTPIQISLVLKIAKIYQVNANLKIVQEVIFTLVKGFFARSLAKTLVKFIPFFNIPLYLAISYLFTNAIGLTAIRVFESQKTFEFETFSNIFEKEIVRLKRPLRELVNNRFYFENLTRMLERFNKTDFSAQDEIKKQLFFIPNNN